MMVKRENIAKYVSKYGEIDQNAKPGWVMKSFESDNEEEDFVTLIQLAKDQVFCVSINGRMGRTALQGCYVVYYMLNSVGRIDVFTEDDMKGAMELTTKIIELIEA